jgi:hypothetical protein
MPRTLCHQRIGVKTTPFSTAVHAPRMIPSDWNYAASLSRIDPGRYAADLSAAVPEHHGTYPGRVDKTGDCCMADAAAKEGAVKTAGPTTGRGPCRG